MTNRPAAGQPQSLTLPPSSGKEPLINRLADLVAQELRTLGTDFLRAAYRDFVHGTMLVTAAIYLYYLVWRALNSINPDAIIFGLAFYFAELHGFVGLLGYYFQLWDPIEREPPPPPLGTTVDAFILTYNEDPSLLQKTILGVVNMRYPHRTYVLDDGRRPEVRELAQSLGAEYITRPDRAHAKAGNFNHAFALTKGELIATFDADHVPQPNFLERTLGYFRDETVALVQTPQFFYNYDAVQFAADMRKNRIWHEQDVFFHLVQPGKDRWNAAFFCGTNAVLRRKSLQELGGLLVGGITEDMETSLVLQSRGWKSVYQNEILCYGLAALDLPSYHKQRLRWAEGNLRLMRKSNPLTMPGLTVPQRICYFSSIFHWTTGFQKAVFYLTPSIMLLTGVFPIAPFTPSFLKLYFFWLISTIVGFHVASRGRGRLLEEELYNAVNFGTLIRAVVRAFNPIPPKFHVTPKTRSETVSYAEIYPQAAILLFSYVATLWAVYKVIFNVGSKYEVIVVTFLWVMWNAFLMSRGIRLALREQQKRSSFRFRDYVPVKYRWTASGGKVNEGVGVTDDFNDGGLSLLAYEPLPVREDVDLTLYLRDKAVSLVGNVQYAGGNPGPVGRSFAYGIKFSGVTQQQVNLMAEYAFYDSVPRFFQRFKGHNPLFFRLVGRLMLRQKRMRKNERRGINLPVVITGAGTPWPYFVAEDMSISGISLMSAWRLPHSELNIAILTPLGRVPVRGTIRREQEKKFGAVASYLYGIRFEDPTAEAKGILSELFRD